MTVAPFSLTPKEQSAEALGVLGGMSAYLDKHGREDQVAIMLAVCCTIATKLVCEAHCEECREIVVTSLIKTVATIAAGFGIALELESGPGDEASDVGEGVVH